MFKRHLLFWADARRLAGDVRDACIRTPIKLSNGNHSLLLQQVHHQCERGRSHCGYRLRHRLHGGADADLRLCGHHLHLKFCLRRRHHRNSQCDDSSWRFASGDLLAQRHRHAHFLGSTVSISFTTNPLTCSSTTGCSAKSSNAANFNGTAINGGDYIWFNANFTASGIPSKGTTGDLHEFDHSFTANGANYQPWQWPDSTITFSASATCATVSFDK